MSHSDGHEGGASPPPGSRADLPAPGVDPDRSAADAWARVLDWIPGESRTVAACLRRLRQWRVPPRWSRRDWSEELGAVAVLAAWQALLEFDPARGVDRGTFLFQRIRAAAYTRYRQEWTYANHCDRARAAARREPALPGTLAVVDRGDTVEFALRRLPPRDRRIVELLHWEGRTTRAAAEVLGITQQALSKRHGSILGRLRDALSQSSASGAVLGCQSPSVLHL